MLTKSWKNHPKKLHTYGSWEVFFLCRPECPKQPKTSYLFYKLSYPTISGRISAYIPRQNKNFIGKKVRRIWSISVLMVLRMSLKETPELLGLSLFMLLGALDVSILLRSTANCRLTMVFPTLNSVSFWSQNPKVVIS